MSGQSSQRVRRIASPSTKQGPMKATLPFGLVQGSPTLAVNARKNSPSSSPTLIQWPGEGHRVKTRRSPDNRSSPERASPGSPAFKVEQPKPVRLSPSSAIKRTGSLDTIAGPYLTGHWPRCDVNSASNTASQPQDKSTQTEGWDLLEGQSEKRKIISLHKRSSSLGSTDTITEGKISMPPTEPKSAFKIIKGRLAKNKEGNRITNSAPRTSPVSGHHLSLVSSTQTLSSTQSKAVTIPITHIPKSRIRGSVEGPNQEIERALKSISGSGGEELQRQAAIGWLQTAEPTPDGHRAPVLELITRTIDTQTPSAYMEELRIDEDLVPEGLTVKEENGCGDNNRSGQSSRSQSESPDYGLIPGTLDTSRPSSRDETPPAEGCESPSVTKESTPGDLEQCLKTDCHHESILKCVPSPRPNKSFSFVREPPDGCEKVKLEESRTAPPVKEPLLYCPIQKSSQYHIPSVGSAFCPLYKSYMSHQITPPTVMASPSAEAQ